MEPPRSSSRASQPSNKSLSVYKLYPPVITKDSKAQHILGLSRTELHDARSKTLMPELESRPHFHVPPNNSVIRNLLTRRSSKVKRAAIKDDDDDDVRPCLRPHNETASDLASVSQTSSLRRSPSTSTIRSFYDTATGPLRFAQQTSNSLIQQFISYHIDTEKQLVTDDAMDSTRQPKFFQAPKLRSILEDQMADKEIYVAGEANFSPLSRTSTLSGPLAKPSFLGKVSIVSPHPESTSPSKDRTIATVSNFSQQKGLHSRQNSFKDKDSASHAPYAKVHVRRPKAGTKHWFDDLDDVSSEEDSDDDGNDDDDDDDDAEKEQEDAKDEASVRRHIAMQFERPLKSVYAVTRSPTQNHIGKHQQVPFDKKDRGLITELAAEPVVVPSELEGSPIATRQISVRRSFLTPDTMNQESFLSLSSDSDEQELSDKKEEIAPFDPMPTIHRSFSIEAYDESNVQIGFAPLVEQSRKQHSRSSSSTTRTNDKTLVGLSPLDTTVPSQHAFAGDKKAGEQAIVNNQYNDHSDESDDDYNNDDDDVDGKSGSVSDTVPDEEIEAKDEEEDVLLDSFPDTPTDMERPRRFSSHSSVSIPDNKSMDSMRLMKVTRQEQNLIAAMREKRAVMKRAEQITARETARETEDTGEEMEVVFAYQPQLSDAISKPKTSIIKRRPVPVNLSAINTSRAEPSRRRPVTACVTTSDGTFGPGVASLHKAMDESGLGGSSTLPPNHNLATLLQRPDSTVSTESESSQKSNGEIIELYNLESAVTSPIIPSHMFIESPFKVWKRIDSAGLDQE